MEDAQDDDFTTRNRVGKDIRRPGHNQLACVDDASWSATARVFRKLLHGIADAQRDPSVRHRVIPGDAGTNVAQGFRSEGNTRPPDGKTIQAELGVIRLLADENFNNNIVRGVRLRNPRIDLVRVQDVGLSGANDPSVLEWAAGHQRVLLTHDLATIKAFAYERVRAGKPMPGII
jgi:hypothetical protein